MFNPFRAYRERRDAALRAERDHQLALVTQVTHGLEAIFDSLASQQKESTKAMVEIVKPIAAQAESFSKWLDCFRTTDVPTTSTVRDEDEYAAEQARLLAAGFPADDFPEEFRLALALQRAASADLTP